MKNLKITKKELNSLVQTSIDGFGRNFVIDTTSDFDSKFTLIATRESLKSQIKINFNGKKINSYMNSASKKEFIDCVYNAIN